MNFSVQSADLDVGRVRSNDSDDWAIGQRCFAFAHRARHYSTFNISNVANNVLYVITSKKLSCRRETVSVSRTIFEILGVKEWSDLETGRGH